jgi:glutathione peroxidase
MILSFLSMFAVPTTVSAAESIHEITVKTIDGEAVGLDQYAGKWVLIVNTASKCGFTRQYEDLMELQNAYREKGVVVLGFPANNFNNQEPGTDADIKTFCSEEFGVTFPMFSKVSVKGNDQHPLFQYLTTAENPDYTGNIRWNFEKFLVGPDGKLIRRFRSMTNPSGKKMANALDEALAAAPSP